MSAPACRFFQQGKCRRGASCSFSHHDVNPPPPSSSSSSSPFSSSSPENTLHLSFPPEAHLVSIDVECAATSVDHHGRAVCSVGMVDSCCRPLVDLLVRPYPLPLSDSSSFSTSSSTSSSPVQVLSYLTPITGVRKEDVEERGVSFDYAVEAIRSHLNPDTIVIGQNILKDIQWLGLQEGKDFGSLVDLTALFRVWNPPRNSFTYFSQDHVAKTWLGIEQRQTHNATEDAYISMSLLHAYLNVQWDPNLLHQYQMITLNSPRTLGYASHTGAIEGCCLGNRKTCTCGTGFVQS